MCDQRYRPAARTTWSSRGNGPRLGHAGSVRLEHRVRPAERVTRCHRAALGVAGPLGEAHPNGNGPVQTSAHRLGEGHRRVPRVVVHHDGLLHAHHDARSGRQNAPCLVDSGRLRPMSRWLRASRVVAILASLPSCGGGATTPTPTQATITVTLTQPRDIDGVCAYAVPGHGRQTVPVSLAGDPHDSRGRWYRRDRGFHHGDDRQFHDCVRLRRHRATLPGPRSSRREAC